MIGTDIVIKPDKKHCDKCKFKTMERDTYPKIHCFNYRVKPIICYYFSDKDKLQINS